MKMLKNIGIDKKDFLKGNVEIYKKYRAHWQP